MKEKLPSGTLDKLWADSNNWRVGIIYVCKDDPRLFVPKKPKWGGWTLNFGHGSAWTALLVCILSIAVPTAWLVRARLIGACIGYEAGIIAFWCVLSWVLSSPKRYERPKVDS